MTRRLRPSVRKSQNKRYFTLVSINGDNASKYKDNYGRFNSASPSGAVKKAFNSILRSGLVSKKLRNMDKNKGNRYCKGENTVLELVIRETSGNQKEYTYKVKRITYKKPKIVKLRDGTKIVYCYNTVAERL